jgi:hypothetical protein
MQYDNSWPIKVVVGSYAATRSASGAEPESMKPTLIV